MIAAEEAKIRIALQKGGYRRAESVSLRDAAVGSLIEDLHDAADDLSIQDYSLECRMDCDGNLAVAASFATEADMVLFEIRVS
jgi:hypothetical protein